MIREKRNARKYTQAQMANVLNMSLRQYARIDKEEDISRRYILRKLIEILNLSDEDIGMYIRKMVS